MLRPVLVAAVFLAACGVESPEIESESEDALSQEILSTWPSGKAEGITVWLSPIVSVKQVDGQTRWVVSGRTSRNVTDAFSYIPDDPVGMAQVVSKRKFEVQLANEEIRALAMGRQLLVRLTPETSGRSYTVAISGSPQFISQEGSSRIFLRTEVKPVVVGKTVLFRGRTSTTSNMSTFEVNAGSASPLVTKISTRTWQFDWTAAQLESVAAGFNGSVELRAAASDGTVFTRHAALAFTLGAVQVTDGAAEAAFPVPSCRAATKSCLSGLATLDTESCGTAVAVLACGGAVSNAPSADRFVTDLRAHLVTYYAQYGADVKVAGGNSLEGAQGAVAVSAVEEVLENDEDPRAHDLSRVRVFRHADVVFPGSDRVWFGAYDRDTGALYEIYDFN